MDVAPQLQSLAARLRRPAGALRDLERLAPSELAELEAWVERASERQRREVDSALRKALFWPLRALILRGLPQGRE